MTRLQFLFKIECNTTHTSYYVFEKGLPVKHRCPIKVLDNIVRSSDHIVNQPVNKAAKSSRRQRHELHKTIRFTIGTMMMNTCYIIISSTILPAEKFMIDKVYRDQLPMAKMFDINEIWGFINDHVVDMNFPSG